MLYRFYILQLITEHDDGIEWQKQRTKKKRIQYDIEHVHDSKKIELSDLLSSKKEERNPIA